MSHPIMLPDKDLSRRLLESVPYKDRLSAGRLLPPVGIIRGHVRSLRELYLLLAPDDRSLPGVNFKALVDWVRRVLGDKDLADGIQIITHEAGSYVEGCLKVYELIGLRLTQARKVAGQEALT